MLMPLTEEEKNALQLLGVHDCFDTGQLILKEDMLRKQFRKQALSTHPDRAAARGGDPERMQSAFLDISESYQLLMNRIMIQKGVSYRTSRVHVRPEPKEKVKEKSVSLGFYKGRFPDKKLRFAEYLYYKKAITWEQLISALSWQFLNRPKIGEMARDKAWLTDSQILQIIRLKKSSQRFGLAAVNNGFLSVEQCREILRAQKRQNLPIGRYFLIHGIMDRTTLNENLGRFLLHNSRFKRK
ncbi:MAG: hypothetical protein JXA95_19555 [Spirochaetales bacterium]|nr:hypothetical protein [Spirochaetales bacterium]